MNSTLPTDRIPVGTSDDKISVTEALSTAEDFIEWCDSEDEFVKQAVLLWDDDKDPSMTGYLDDLESLKRRARTIWNAPSNHGG